MWDCNSKKHDFTCKNMKILWRDVKSQCGKNMILHAKTWKYCEETYKANVEKNKFFETKSCRPPKLVHVGAFDRTPCKHGSRTSFLPWSHWFGVPVFYQNDQEINTKFRRLRNPRTIITRMMIIRYWSIVDANFTVEKGTFRASYRYQVLLNVFGMNEFTVGSQKCSWCVNVLIWCWLIAKIGIPWLVQSRSYHYEEEALVSQAQCYHMIVVIAIVGCRIFPPSGFLAFEKVSKGVEGAPFFFTKMIRKSTSDFDVHDFRAQS